MILKKNYELVIFYNFFFFFKRVHCGQIQCKYSVHLNVHIFKSGVNILFFFNIYY